MKVKKLLEISELDQVIIKYNITSRSELGICVI